MTTGWVSRSEQSTTIRFETIAARRSSSSSTTCFSDSSTFRFAWQSRIEGWERGPPPIGRLMAAGSVVLWLTVAALGRWIAYS